MDGSKEGAQDLASLWRYALLGGTASALMSVVELLDLNFLLTPVFRSRTDRLVFSAFFSINLLSGLFIGLVAGLITRLASLVYRLLVSAISRGRKPSPLLELSTGLVVISVAAFLLNQQPHIFGFTIGLVREAEKFPALTATLLDHERATSYLIALGLFITCWVFYSLARRASSLPDWLRQVWLAALIVLIAVFYYIDSRLEVQLYEYSLHRSMFLAVFTLAMALVSSVYLSLPQLQSIFQVRSARFKLSLTCALLALIACALIFTFARFDKDHNLKTQIFYRTTQAKQHFKLVQWALDFDRDGYSAYLGGGDRDDSNRQINPSQREVSEDAVDNNCVGGDLKQADLEAWNQVPQSIKPPARPGAKRLNVIFIFIDTLRPDHMSAYGYERNTTPNIARLAERSAVFDNAFTPAPDTYGALPKFMQSNYWDGNLKSWTELLALGGYETIIFRGRLSTMLRHVKGMSRVIKTKRKGLNKKIDFIVETLDKRISDRPFCSFLYVVDPHSPYVKRKDFYYGDSDVDRYDGEIAYTDHQLGKVFDWLETSGKINDTAVVVMSDHGESLGERSVYKHSSQLYNEQLRIPMIIYLPNQPHKRIADYVSSVDLGPTILDMVGIDHPGDRAGVSLLPLMRGEAFTHPPIFAEHVIKSDSPFVTPEKNVNPEARKYSVITQDGFKLIFNRNFFTFELFDLNEDPGEERNLYSRWPEKAETMKELLGDFIDVVTASRPWDADETKYYFYGD